MDVDGFTAIKVFVHALIRAQPHQVVAVIVGKPA